MQRLDEQFFRPMLWELNGCSILLTKVIKLFLYGERKLKKESLGRSSW